MAARLDNTLISQSFATHAPLSFIRSIAQPEPEKIWNSTRYSVLKDQLLSHVRQPSFEGYWICRGLNKTPIDPKNADVVLIYTHGGGYVLGHPFPEAPNLLFVAESLARKGLTAAIFALRYSVAPESRFPKQVDEAASAYSWLVRDLGVSPSKVALLGESAGAHLALSFLVDRHLKSKQATVLPKPASAFLISPWCDLHNSNPKATNIRPGEVVFKGVLTRWGDSVLDDLDAPQRALYLDHVQRNAQRGSWKDILPASTWVSAGDDENIFVHDIIDFVGSARDDGANISLEIEPGGRHAWQTDAARPQHAALLGSEPGADCTGLIPAWESLAASIAATVKSSSSQAAGV